MGRGRLVGVFSVILAFVLLGGIVDSVNRPQPAGAASLTQDEAIYVGKMSVLTDLWGASVQAYVNLTKNPQPLDATWKEDVIAQTQTWKALDVEITKITPPARFAQVHAKMVQAFSLMNHAADDIRTGTDQLDAASIGRANGELAQAAQLAQQADQLLDSAK